MTRRLVKLDRDGWLTEIDLRALQREAAALRAYVDAADARERQVFDYDTVLVPLIEGVLSGAVPIPYKGAAPYNRRLIDEGEAPELPAGLRPLYEPFLARISGFPPLAATVPPSAEAWGALTEERDGQTYAWVDFED